MVRIGRRRKRRTAAPPAPAERVTPSLRRVERERRVARICPVCFEWRGARVRAVAGNLSRGGIFVRTSTPPPAGEVVELTVTLSRQLEALLLARVVHVLTPEVAAALGRRPGAGFHFVERGTPARQAIAQVVDRAVAGTPRSAALLPRACRVLVAEDNCRLLDRLVTALGGAGFTLETALDGAAAFSACETRLADVVVASDTLPILDGWALAKRLAQPIARGEVTFVLMSDGAPDAARLAEHGLDGARNWLQKPFTDDDLCERLRRIAGALASQLPRPSLSMGLEELALGTLLAFFEREQKSGIVVVTHQAERVPIHIRTGRIVNVEAGAKSPSEADVRAKLHEVLDWEDGELEFRAQEVPEGDVINCAVSRLLFDHARLFDERDTQVRSA